MIGDRCGVTDAETLRPYSYDWIDNLGRIVSVDPGKQLTGAIMGAFLSYVLVPVPADRTRLRNLRQLAERSAA